MRYWAHLVTKTPPAPAPRSSLAFSLVGESVQEHKVQNVTDFLERLLCCLPFWSAAWSGLGLATPRRRAFEPLSLRVRSDLPGFSSRPRPRQRSRRGHSRWRLRRPLSAERSLRGRNKCVRQGRPVCPQLSLRTEMRVPRGTIFTSPGGRRGLVVREAAYAIRIS